MLGHPSIKYILYKNDFIMLTLQVLNALNTDGKLQHHV